MTILTIVGARPQFIKAAPVSRAFQKAGLPEYLVHTGQHYDSNMSQIFFDELGIPQPQINLGIGSASHGRQTGEMLIQLETLMMEIQPDWVLVYGDTNSTLAGALAAVKLHIPVAHVEAGLRSYNRSMPEEHNRVLTDHSSDLLFCPTQTAVDNLAQEGIRQGVFLTGDVMYDAVIHFAARAQSQSSILDRLNLHAKGYLLATVHRPANTDNPHRLYAILDTLRQMDEPVILPLHPRTRDKMRTYGWNPSTFAGGNLRIIEPVGYLDMLMLEQHARLILTDSGGIQKEAYFFSVPCITLREETEWIETVAAGWNILVGADTKRIQHLIQTWQPEGTPPPIFGDGHAAANIASILAQQS